MPPKSIAVLGGGLTGLSSAFHLSRRFPTAKVTVIEKQARLGGWVRSERIKIREDASMLLEAGPRTLRPNSKSVLELINLLSLEDNVITVPKTAPAAQARFLYIPTSSLSKPAISGLQRLPSSFTSLLTSPLRPLILPAVLREPFKLSNRPTGARDESVDSFLSRRFGETFARIFGSALVHGIYATDSRNLSVRTAFPILWEAEERGWGSVVRGFLLPGKRKSDEDAYDLGKTLELMHNVSVYSFKNGMQSLTNALETRLLATTNVDIIRDTIISNLEMLEDGSLKISHSSGKLETSHVVSALPLPILHKIASQPKSSDSVVNLPPIPHLTENTASSVQVVNLVFPCPPERILPEGFGYLIPRPLTGYLDPSDKSSSNMLGTVFDSCSLHEQDPSIKSDSHSQGNLTKVTIMTGGPYPIPTLPHFNDTDRNRPPPDFILSLVDQLSNHLGRTMPLPIYWRLWNNEACIPTLRPGHLDRMEEVKSVLQAPSHNLSSSNHLGWDGRLAIVGAGVGGVSVGDCVEAGRRVGREWA
ncbi:protoporphyrinogen oxidase [Phlegmacium glaucopus]|nr:protoporphyrinogen oxidase [Phlegmacium glaucopus]